MGSRYKPSRVASYIDGNWHALTPEQVGLASTLSITNAFRAACSIRGFRAEVWREGNTAHVRSLAQDNYKPPVSVQKKPSEPMSEEDDDKPETILCESSDLYRLTGEYLLTPIGSQAARNILGRMLAASRGVRW